MTFHAGAPIAAITLALSLTALPVQAADAEPPIPANATPEEIEALKNQKQQPLEDIDLSNYKFTVSDLITTIRQDDCPKAQKILDTGLDPNQYDSFGYTPLTVAAMDKRLECVVSLLKKGADVNIPSAAGWTPLIGAAMSGAGGQLLAVLLGAGADINAQNRWGCTALYYAVGFGALPTVDFLLISGAKYPGTGGECMTPMRLAELREYPQIVERLKKAEADAAKAGQPAAAAAE